MSYYELGERDIIHTTICTHPSWIVSRYGNIVTGSIVLEKSFLAPALANRQAQGFSERLGGMTSKNAQISASVDFQTAQRGGQNKQMYSAIANLYRFYSVCDTNTYTLGATNVRVINIPQIYYETGILSATLTASDHDSAGNSRYLYDNGRGGIYSGSLSGTLVGNIFYSEGIVVLTASNLSDFGRASPDNFSWRVDFKGIHSIPVNIYRCRAPAGQLNASTNPTFYTIPTSGPNKNTKQVLTSSLNPYITAVGLYNDDYELVAVARLAQPIKKEPGWDVTINCKFDW
jgi:hypothetical protein